MWNQIFNFVADVGIFSMWLISIVVILAIPVALVWYIKAVRWYVFLFLAEHDFIFTTVSESYFKIAVRFKAVRRVLLTKQGYKIDANGNIVKLDVGEAPPKEMLFGEELPEGLKFLGWPGIDKAYNKKMKFLKSMSDGSVKSYDEENAISEFYAAVDYPYALVFSKCEDVDNLPISGHATLLACVDGPVASLFGTSNFYDTMVGLILPVVQECFRERFSFDKPMKKQDIDDMMWAELNEKGPNGGLSVIEELKKYGICVLAYRTVEMDPPEELRATTLKKWTAEREADAAEATKRAEAIKAAGPIDYAVEEWVKKEAAEAGETVVIARKRLRASGEYETHKALLADQINRSRKTVQERKVDLTSGGKTLEGGSVAGIAGSIAAAIIGAVAGKGIKEEGGDKGPDSSGGKKPEDMSPEELRAWADKKK